MNKKLPGAFAVGLIMIVALIVGVAFMVQDKEETIFYVDESIDRIPNLFVYSSDAKIDPPYNNDASVVEQYKAEIKFDLLRDENIGEINFNLFDGTNYLVKKKKAISCKDDPMLNTSNICENNQYSFVGELIDVSLPGYVTMSFSDGATLGTIDLPGQKYNYSISSVGILEEEKGRFVTITKIDNSKVEILPD